MTARDQIVNLLVERGVHTLPYARYVADDILADHARELADKILEHDYDPGEVGPIHLAYLAAAELIICPQD